MSTCVNLNLKEFKDCCKRLNVSPTTLEPIVHEYINIEGNENSFPSDAYISERIHGREVSVLSDAQIKVWERKFSEPKTFNSNEEAVAYHNEARKYFPKEAIGFKETRNSKYEVRVAEPFKSNELEEIKKKAIANGTFMKAPNGKPTNLTEQQWLQVRTKAFKRWFGDWENNPENASKVVDENGEPLVVYHGTNDYGFNKFTKSDDNQSYFFTDNKPLAETYVSEYSNALLNNYMQNEANEYPDIPTKEDLENYIKYFVKENYKDKAYNLIKDIKIKKQTVVDYDKFIELRNALWDKIKKEVFEQYKDAKIEDIPGFDKERYNSWIEDYDKNTALYELVNERLDKEFKAPTKEIEGVDLEYYKINKEDKIYEVFLNIKNPYIYNAHGSKWNKIYEEGQYRNTRWIHNKSLENKHDGTFIQNVWDLGGVPSIKHEIIVNKGDHYETHNKAEKANLYVASDSNQIKSATDNIGTYSIEDNTIYYNVSPITVEKTLTNNGLIHRYNDALFVTRKENKNTQQLKEDIYRELERYGYSKESVSFKNKNNSILVTITEPQRKKDYVETEVNKAMSSIKETLEFLTEKIPALKGKIHYNITVEEATKILRRAGKAYHDGINSFVHNGHIYLIQGKTTQDIAIEEALHILTESLIADNRALASEMLHEAQKLFPQLVEDIHKTYKGKDTQNREILTQSLARVFRQEFNEGERQTAESILSKFINWIKQLFGINPSTGNIIIELDQLSTDMTLRDFAQLINSSNAEFKTWKHNKTQFNKSSKEELISSSAQPTPKASDSTLNIWFGSGENDAQRENADLSNFAERPFTIDLSLNHKIADSIGFLNLYGSDIKVPTVEHAFQLAKLSFLPEEILSESSSKGKTTIEKLEEQILNASAAGAKKIGRTIPLTKEGVALWDKHSSTIMKALIKASFEQNPEAFQKLLNTGNTTLTHTQDKGKWGKEFPRLLMEVREELRQPYGSEINILETSSIVESQKTSLHLSEEELEEKTKEIQESLGVTEEEARELAELFDTDNTEEELKQKQQSEEKEDKVRKHLLSIDAQIKELTEGNVISRSEITELAYDIVYTVSDFLTQWQNDPKLIIEKFNKDEKDIEKIKTMSRKELANYIGINNIFDFIKEAYFGEIKPTDSDEVIEKKEVIYDNFEAILQFGKSAFNTIEDFSIGYSEVGYNTKDKSENDNESELTNEEQTAKEELGDKQEHWQIDSRTIDNFLSMSQTVKRELLNLYELEEVVKDGISVIQPKLNAFGMKKRVSPKDATSSILRWTRGALTLKQMIVKLQEKEDKHPWVKELITKLSDDNKTGKYTDFQSQFFNVFCKHFQDYYAVTKETNKDGTTVTKVIPLNLNPALKGAVDAIKILYQVRRHPLFDKSGKVDDIALNTLKKYKELLEKITDKPFEEIDLDRVKTGIFKISQLLGFSTTEEEIYKVLSTNNIKTFIKNLDNIVDNLEKGAKLQNYSPFDFKGANSISGYIREFIRPITERREDTAISSLYDSGKMYQSYVIPSWLSKTMDKFMNLDGEEYKRFLMEEYGQYDWFRDTSVEDITDATAWRCPWLKRLANASLEERRKIFGHHVQLNYLGHNYMKNMSGPEYTLSVINEFFTDTTDSKESIGTAWYKIPMMSNKPSAEFIKFIRYKGLTYKNDITNELVNVYIQELMRIQTVIQRGYTKNDPEFIKAFDNRGKHFLFLDYLDEYLNGSKKNQELGKLLNAKVLGKKLPDATITVKGETKIISGEQRLLDLVKNEIRTQMDAKVASIIESYKANGIFEAAKNVQGISKTDEELTRDLENFIWNDTFASINILQMTITDLAYYKDTEDVQKRLAQIHAPGMRPNVEATDYEGNRVCPDGMFRTAFLKDFEGKAVFELDEIIQNVIDNIEVVFQRKIDVAKSNNNKIEEEYWTSTMNFIIDQLKETVNVADAQAFNCPTSYRKKALMFGKWDKKYEEVYQKLKNKEYNINDLEAAFQPLKPFVYTSTSKDSGVTNTPIKNMKVGMQFKNSEYLLIMADAILRGEDTGKPNLLRAIFDVMEESAKKHPGKGIDSIMFGSAVKAGLHGQIDIADSMTEEEAKARLEVIFDSNSKDGMYNPTFVHTYPAEDYTIQQEVPAHFMDHDQAHGTQERMIIPSDLPLVDENGNEVFFEYYDYKEGKVVKKNAKEFRKAYEENIAESINQNLEELEDALGLNIVGPDAKRQRNIKLSKILQEEILSSPRYGIDLYVACSVNEKGEFNIPLGDPVQSKRVEQLINSVIKNRLNKQKIAGGPVVQVSNFGMSKRLSIKFKKEDGNILPTFKEWQAENENGTIEDYKEMLKKEQAGIAHYECYAPAYMKEMFECFMNEKGELDVEAMEESNPEMLEMVGYRIPSEDAYSVAPLKIVGFLPKEAGEGIVMPYEITLITGSDFDKH